MCTALTKTDLVVLLQLAWSNFTNATRLEIVFFCCQPVAITYILPMLVGAEY